MENYYHLLTKFPSFVPRSKLLHKCRIRKGEGGDKEYLKVIISGKKMFWEKITELLKIISGITHFLCKHILKLNCRMPSYLKRNALLFIAKNMF